MAAGLAGMVASMSRGKKAYAQNEPQLSEAVARLASLREELKAAIDADAASYNAVVKAYKAAKGSSDGKSLINAALREASAVPLGVAERSAEVAGIAADLRAITSPMMKSDLITAIALAGAAVKGALANVEINIDSIEPSSADDEAFVMQARERAAELSGLG
jgi:formiminotetrahydrofolate cyclodeaminase